MKKIILLSNSPRRKELLRGADVDFTTRHNSFEENTDASLPPAEFVMQSALDKLNHTKSNEHEIVISADTIVYFNKQIIGKPKDLDIAFNTVKEMCGKSHTVYTGIAVKDHDTQEIIKDYEATDVYFNKLNDNEIKTYLRQINPLDKAGAYAIQDHGSILVNRIDGCYYNVMGLPVSKLFFMLKQFKVNLFTNG